MRVEIFKSDSCSVAYDKLIQLDSDFLKKNKRKAPDIFLGASLRGDKKDKIEWYLAAYGNESDINLLINNE